MSLRAYYNEVDPYAAQWLRNLIAAGLITPGDVDTRSILDVRPSDVAGYARCHWFAGIGVWDYALGLAGWPADRRVWTGSCPCQPFSAAGGRAGFADERHLWPSWHHLICECGPEEVLGEQVASKDGLAWLDLVQADMEGSGYAFWAADLCAAGVGAPHIRQRSWFVANAESVGGQPGPRDQGTGRERGIQPRDRSLVRILGDAEGIGRQGREPLSGSITRSFDAGAGAARQLADAGGERRYGEPARLWQPTETGWHSADHSEAAGRREARELAHSDGWDASAERQQRGREHGQQSEDGCAVPHRWTGAHHGGWGDADWIRCRDGRWRPIEPGTFPLVDGAAFRVGSGSAFEGQSRIGMLKGYGNAINAEAATTFIGAYLDCRPTYGAAA